MRDAEDLLRDVMGDPAYDVTPDGDPLAPVWRKARAIRRRRTLAAGGTAVVVIAAAVATGIAVSGPQAKGGPTVVGPATATAPARTPSAAPSATPSPTLPTVSAAAPPIHNPRFTHTEVNLTSPIAIGADVVGISIGEGGPTSFRIAVLNTATGKVAYTPTIAGDAQGVATADGAIWVTTLHTTKLIRFDLADLTRLPDVADPNGKLVGPIATVGNYVAVADSSGVSLVREGISTPAPVLRQGLVCSISRAVAVGGLLVLGGDAGGACRDVTAVNLAANTHSVVATASDLSLGLQGVVPDESGFWVEQPSGTMGYYEHVAYTNAGGPPVVTEQHVGGSNAMVGSYAGGHGWIGDPGSLRCVDPQMKVLFTTDVPTSAGGVRLLDTTTGTVMITRSYAEPFDTSVCK